MTILEFVPIGLFVAIFVCFILLLIGALIDLCTSGCCCTRITCGRPPRDTIPPPRIDLPTAWRYTKITRGGDYGLFPPFDEIAWYGGVMVTCLIASVHYHVVYPLTKWPMRFEDIRGQ